jgi:hypothetical protein
MEEFTANLTHIMFSKDGKRYIGVHTSYTFKATKMLRMHLMPSISEVKIIVIIFYVNYCS